MKLPHVFLASILSLFFTTATPSHADWWNFRGPNGNGYVDAEKPVTTNLSKETIAWSVELPGRGLSCPVIVGDRVFLTCSSGPDQKRLHVFCFSAADGSILWERQFWAMGRTMCNPKTCVAAPSPATDGERVYALFSSNDLFCLDLDGNVQWIRALTLDYPNASNSLGMASSPIVVDGTLVVQIENDSESFAAGIDPLTGTNVWKLDRPKAANWTSPVVMEVEGTTVVALQSTKGVLGVVPKTGSELWNYGDGASPTPSSAVADGTLYIPSNGLTAFKPGATGGEEGTAYLWRESAQGPGTASPLIVGDLVYTINGAGVLSAASRETGERVWRTRLTGPFSGSPVAAGNHLYIFNEAGLGQCVDLSGEEGKIVSEVDLGETILSTPAISGGAVYIRSDRHLWKFAE